jgi:ATP-dependent DNA helicase PIF1
MSAPATSTTTPNTEQHEAIKRVVDGESIFITGQAGTGKSFTLHQIVSALKKKNIEMGITSNTGIAATLVGGCTAHSFFKLGLGTLPAKAIATNIRNNKEAKERILKLRVWINDEISMMSGELFEKIDEVCRLVRNSDKPFGGLQVVLLGDFHQLPPVEKGRKVFQTELWSRVFPAKQVVQLVQIQRQNEVEFLELLQEVRAGVVSDRSKAVIAKQRKPLTVTDGIEPTRIFAKKFETNGYNIQRLGMIEHKQYDFASTDSIFDNFIKEDDLNKRMMPQSNLSLKLGAQVMLVKNMMLYNLCNGSRGVISGIEEFKKSHIITVRFTDGQERVINREKFEIVGPKGTVLAARMQYPLILAWATTIHKSQGMTIDRAVVNVADCFEYGHVYVALSRVRSLKGLQIDDFQESKVTTDPDVLQYYQTIKKTTERNNVLYRPAGSTEAFQEGRLLPAAAAGGNVLAWADSPPLKPIENHTPGSKRVRAPPLIDSLSSSSSDSDDSSDSDSDSDSDKENKRRRKKRKC